MKLTDLWNHVRATNKNDVILNKLVDDLLIEYVDGKPETALSEYEHFRNMESFHKMQGERDQQLTCGNAADAFAYIHKLLKEKKK